MKRFAPLVAASLLVLAMPASADDFTDTLDSAKKAYAEGDFATASEDLTYATQLLSQKRAANLGSFLPKALAGWTMDDQKSGSSAGAGLAAFGGGTSAEASYRKGDDTVRISIVADSPLIASMAMIMNSAAAASQGTVKRINREKVMVKEDGELQSMVDNRILVSVTGSGSAQDKEAYFKEIDFKGLKAF
ncbi:MAG: hypothetical protein R3E68_22355 [Burkholderiaceae bacterium]